MKRVMWYLIPILVVILTGSLLGCAGRKVLQSDMATDVPPVINEDSDEQRQIHVWFVRTKGEELELVPALRSVSSGHQVEDAVRELLRGPNEDESNLGLASEIPKGTVLIDVQRRAGDISLNLSRRFVSGGGTASFETRLEQLKRTLSEVSDPRKVYLDVEGKRLLIAGEGLEIKQPIN